MNKKSNAFLFSASPSPLASLYDDEVTRPVPLQLIARLAAEDPTVQLKIGVTVGADGLQIDDEAAEKTGE